MPNVTYIFCHGLNGWGQYDERYQEKPYFGGTSGDVVARWREQGLEAYAPSVSPQGSAWDRACELYVQLAGTRADYGAAHAAEYKHSRFGRDFSNEPLIPTWDDDTRLVLIGHSFGGATIRLFAELLTHGSSKERGTTPAADLSPLFEGSMGERVVAIVTLAAPTNGTTAYDLALDPSFNAKRVKVPFKYKLWDRILKSHTKIKADDRDPRDWANFDMQLDNAQALNRRIATLPHVYYLSVACDATKPGTGDTRVADPKLTDPLFVKTGTLMGCYHGTTKAGCVVDSAWYPNDGLVNTFSARAPFDAPQKPFDPNHIERGVWNVMPDLHTDHGFFQGGFIKKRDPQPFFQDLLEILQTIV